MSRKTQAWKDGYNAFTPGESKPLRFCKYYDESGGKLTLQVDNWLDGWKKAEEHYIMEEAELEGKINKIEEEKKEFDNIKHSCPWNTTNGYSCIATKDDCLVDKCAVWYILKEK